MENMLNLTPTQSILVMALNVWIFVVFPMIVIKKLNYLASMMEAQLLGDEDEEDQAPF